MNEEESIRCQDGSTVTRLQAQLICEKETDTILGTLRKSMLEAVTENFTLVWDGIASPTQKDIPVSSQVAEEMLRQTVRVSIMLAMSRGSQAAMKRSFPEDGAKS